jgi:hypothetical protein
MHPPLAPLAPRPAIFAASLLVALAACNSKEFNESFCASYKDSFIKSCTDTCAAKSGQRDTCATQCTAALPKDDTWKGRCPNTAAGKAVSPSSPAASSTGGW